MNKNIHFHFYSRFIAITIVLLASLFLLQKSDNIEANGIRPNPVEIGGWAWSESVGWISLNCKNDFDGDGILEDTCSTAAIPYKLEVSEGGAVVGCAWGGTSKNGQSSTTIGYVCFSDPGGTEAPTDGIHIVTETGVCEGPVNCTLDSQCNDPGETIWRCSNGYCQNECSSDSDCRSGAVCSIAKGNNFLCGDFDSPQIGCNTTTTNNSAASIVDFEDIGYDAWQLNFGRNFSSLNTSTESFLNSYDPLNVGFDQDNPNWDNTTLLGGGNGIGHPIEGCFNCSEKNVGDCYYTNGYCEEGDGYCESKSPVPDTCVSGACARRGTECTGDDDCPAIATGEDYCELQDIVYECDNCLDYHYYDKENALGDGDQCSYSAKSCVYVDTSYPSNGYHFMRAITINSDMVFGSTNLIDFPLFIQNNDSFLAWTGKGGNVESTNGYDIIFTSDAAGNNFLDHELDYYNYRTGDMNAWVRIPSLDTSTDTTIYMFYGNPSITASTEEPSALWSSNYYFVSHMNNYSSGVESNVDGTLGTKYGTDGPNQVVGSIGYGQYFDGVDDYIDFGDIEVSNLPVTLSAWWTIADTEMDKQPYNIITSDDESNSLSGVWLRVFDQLEVGFGDGSGRQSKSTIADLRTGSHYFTGVIGSTDQADMLLYVDGTSTSTHAVSGNLSSYTTSTAPFVIGRRYLGATDDYNTGRIDEVRVAKKAFSSDWIKTEYKNKTDYSNFYSIGCRQRYSPATNGDDSCDCNNPDYADFPCDTSCDVCEEAELNDFYKVLGGYDCTDCTISDYTNSCELSAFDQNLNKCASCASVYISPGVMFDNQNNTIPTTTTSGCNTSQSDPGAADFCDRGFLCGWGYNIWTLDSNDDYGLGWFQFSPRITTTSKPYFSVEGGNIYSRGSIFSRYSPPLGKYNATYLIEAGGAITNIISSSTISHIYEGELAYRPTLDFFELVQTGSSQKYKSSLGVINYTGLITDVATGIVGSGTNKFGATISTSNLNGDILRYPFNGMLKYVSGDFTYTQGNVSRQDFEISNDESTGIIVVDGDLTLNDNVSYETIGVGAITTFKKIPSLVWIVRGDVIVDPSVTELSGTFIVLGDPAADCSTPTNPGCGNFSSGVGPNQLIVNGSALARSFSLGRTYNNNGAPAEKFYNTGRLQINPPRGLEDFSKLAPRYSF